MRRLVRVAVVLTLVWGSRVLSADDSTRNDDTPVEAQIDRLLAGIGTDRTIRFPIGRSGRGAPIWCLAQPEALDPQSTRQRRLIVGGLDGSAASVDVALAAFDAFCAERNSETVWACVPIANPDRWADRDSTAPAWSFPPTGTAYNDPQTREAHFLWRFAGWFAPDVVEEIHSGSAAAWPADGLAATVRTIPVADIGTTFSLRTAVVLPPADGQARRQAIAATVEALRQPPSDHRLGGHAAVMTSQRSPLRRAIEQRSERTPIEVARQLSSQYGQHLKTVKYQPALALVARVRLGELTDDPAPLAAVEQIVSRYLDDDTATLPEKPSGSHLAGHFIFAELATATGRPEYRPLVQRAADFGFTAEGMLREAMPFHSQMSDAVFMSCPILTAAARLTGEERYLRMAGRHLRFMQQHCLREDGLYRHSPLCEAAWGRGNGFPALGLALCLTDLDALADSPPVDELQRGMASSLEAHLQALLPHQDMSGMWQQVIDDSGSYRELTSTCMITFALARAIRSGWIDEAEFGPAARRGWEAIKVRVGEDGALLDVCTGTGKQKTLQDYRDRTAILGPDERGGAMALMAAVEMAAWQANPAPAGTVAPPPSIPRQD